MGSLLEKLPTLELPSGVVLKHLSFGLSIALNEINRQMNQEQANSRFQAPPRRPIKWGGFAPQCDSVENSTRQHLQAETGR